MTAKVNKVGLVFATIAGGVHVVWSLVVLFGWAQGLINFILWAHMISIPLIVRPFNFATALILIVITASIGYLVGYVVATVWNKINHAKWAK